MNDTAKERIATVIRNIRDREKCCPMVTDEDLANCIAPAIGVYSSEYEAIKAERDALSKENEDKRFALEMIASNIYSHNIVKIAKEAIETRGLPGRKL